MGSFNVAKAQPRGYRSERGRSPQAPPGERVAHVVPIPPGRGASQSESITLPVLKVVLLFARGRNLGGQWERGDVRVERHSVLGLQVTHLCYMPASQQSQQEGLEGNTDPENNRVVGHASQADGDSPDEGVKSPACGLYVRVKSLTTSRRRDTNGVIDLLLKPGRGW